MPDQMDRLKQVVSAELRKRTAGPHPPADSLSAFAENALHGTEREQLLSHLGECADCREIISLAQMQPANDLPQASAYKPGLFGHIAFRWAAVAASVIVVAGGIFLTRPGTRLPGQKSVTSKASVQEYDRLAEKNNQPDAEPAIQQAHEAKAPAPVRDNARDKLARNSVRAVRPAEKHMTAHMQPPMMFDNTDQVQTAPAPLAKADSTRLDAPIARGQVFGASNEGGTNAAQPARPKDAGADMNTVEVASAAPEEKSKAADFSQAQKAKDTLAESGGISNEQQEREIRAKKSPMHAASMASARTPLPRWIVTSDGALQRSFDSGNTWQSVSIENSKGEFRAVFYSGTDVWAGGKAGLLYHSSDAGQNWKQITPSWDGGRLRSDIVRIDFSNLQHGSVNTADGDIWITADGGQTWRKQ